MKWYLLVLIVTLAAGATACLDMEEPEWATKNESSSNEGPTAVKDGQVCGEDDLSPPEDSLRLHFIDVGQGDAIWVQTPDGKNILIDGGDLEYSENDGGQYVINYLTRWGFQPGSTFDAVFVTHGHADHFGGIVKVLREYNTVAYVDPGYDGASANTYFTLLSDMKAAVTTDNYYRPAIGTLVSERGQEFNLFGSQVKSWLLFADKAGIYGEDDHASLNNTSIVLRLAYAGRSVMLMADAETDVENILVNFFGNSSTEPKLDAHILKAGHHGSDTSSGKLFVDAVFRNIDEDDRYVVIQSGRRSYSGTTLPRPEIIQRFFSMMDDDHLYSTEAGDLGKSEALAPGDDDVLAVIKSNGDMKVCYSRRDLQ